MGNTNGFRTKSAKAQFERRLGTRSLKKRFLIVCEDSKSCHPYFDELVRFNKISASSVTCCPSNYGTNPRNVVRYAVALNEKASRRGLAYDEVWCVMDGDYGPQIKSVRPQAFAKKVNLAISTMCFEHWLHLHFTDHDKACTNCDCVCGKLRDVWSNYSKGRMEFREIMDRVAVACERAKRQRERFIEICKFPEDQNPCSDVYVLVERILSS